MQANQRNSTPSALAVLHPVFLLTGILHAIGGPLLPSIASTIGLTDSQSGLLFLLYFAGSSLGALLCVGKYARAMAIGFVLVAICCLGMATLRWPVLLSASLILGVGVGLPMSAVSLFVGRGFPGRSAPVLTLLNFSWSAGALLAPLLAARVLAGHNFRMAYALLAAPAAFAALTCIAFLRDVPEASCIQDLAQTHSRRRTIAAFALAAFLEVGIENTAAAWLSTYLLRTTHSGAVLAATLSSFYWTGFLVARAGSSLVLLRIKAFQLLLVTVPAALVAALLLIAAPAQSVGDMAMFLLGAALAPIYPLIVAESFGRVKRSADTRWVLAAAGLGGSVLPGITGWVSAQSGSIRAGILTIPSALLLILLLLPFLRKGSLLPKAPTSQVC